MTKRGRLYGGCDLDSTGCRSITTEFRLGSSELAAVGSATILGRIALDSLRMDARHSKQPQVMMQNVRSYDVYNEHMKYESL